MTKSGSFFADVRILQASMFLLAGLIITTIVISPVLGVSAAFQDDSVESREGFRVMSFNIRYGTADDKENAWPLRRDLVFDIISEYQPQLVGLQEALDFQLDEITEKLPEYAFVGVGRDDGIKEGEFSAILYLKGHYRVIESETFWLSDTPTVPGSKTWGNTIPRIVTWAKFEDIRLNKQFYVFNTHFDHRSQPSREKSAQLIVDRVRAREDSTIPAVITGDFNAGEYNPVIRYMVEDQAITMSSGEALTNPQPFKDTFRTRHPEAVKVGTANRFTGYSVGPKIDYIFVAGQLAITGAAIIRDNDQGRYPSDHFPVIADLSF